MQDERNSYIDVEHQGGYGDSVPERVYSATIPETLIDRNPIELQEVCYTAGGRGVHCGYSYRPDTVLTFNSEVPPVARLHKHEYFELLFVLSAHLEVQIESKLCQLTRGDVCILNCSTRHAEHFEPDLSLCYLLLTPNYLRGFPPGEGTYQPDELHDFFIQGMRDPFLQKKNFLTYRWLGGQQSLPLVSVLADMRNALAEKQPGYPLFVRGYVLRMFALLADRGMYRPEYTDLGNDDGFSLAFSAKQLLDKTNARLNRRQLADRLNYSAGHIDRMFQRHYGCTISAYSRNARLHHAADLLLQTPYCVQDICKQLGISDRTGFYRCFVSEFGCTPSQYRAKNKL